MAKRQGTLERGHRISGKIEWRGLWNHESLRLDEVGHFVERVSQQAVGSLGYFSAEAFKQWYNKLLDAKIQKTGSDRTVRFSDVDFNLKIVSADVSASELVVHSRETCPDRPIAEAVAASISIPLFFQPQKIDEGNLHVDGGILSNSPAWLFLDETEADVRPPRGSPGLTLAVL